MSEAKETLDQINRIVHVLETVRDKPALWVGPNLAGMKHFLDGFHLATGILAETPQWDEVYAHILEEHGWRAGPDPVGEMTEKGLDAVAIARELLTIYLETWQALRHTAADQLQTKMR